MRSSRRALLFSARPGAGLRQRERVFASALLPFLFLCPLSAQHAQKSAQNPAQSTTSRPDKIAQPDELQSRLATAVAARQGGDPELVANANTLVVASALREMAAVRSAEGALPQAEVLYEDSLALEQSPVTRIALAAVEAEAGHYEDAIQLAQQIHQVDPQNLQADRVLSSSLMQRNGFVDALEPLGQLARADHQVETQYALANCLLQTKRPEDKLRAQSVFHEIAAEHGDSGSLHVLIGRAYRDGGDLPDAVAEFQRALQIDPKTPHAHYFLGLAKLSLNEWRPTPEAETEIRTEAELYPHDYLANYMTGFLASGERHYAEADPFLKTAATLDPSAPEPWLYLGLNAYAQSDYQTAEAALRKAVELTGNDEARSNFQIRRAYVDLGRILANSGRKQESEAFLAKARDLQNKTMEQSQQSIAGMAAAGSNAAGVVALNQPTAASTRALGSDETATLDGTARTLPAKLTPEQRSELQQRETQLRAVLALAYNDLGTTQAVQGHFPAAVGLYRKAEQWDNTLPGLEKNLGQSEFRAAHYEAAISPLTQAALQEPSNHALRAMLGIAYFDLNRFTEAARTFAPLGRAGMQDDQSGQVDSAIAHLQTAEQSSPRTEYIHFQLQAAYRKANRTEDADKELALYKQLKADAREQAAARASVH